MYIIILQSLIYKIYLYLVGACGGGKNADCDGYWAEILCCSLPIFYYSYCEKVGSHHGELNSCLDHGDMPLLLEGSVTRF